MTKAKEEKIFQGMSLKEPTSTDILVVKTYIYFQEKKKMHQT